MPGSRPRWMLHVQAVFWRFLMGIGMSLHKMARPRPSRPAFHRDIDATVSPIKGKFRIHFYVPKDYKRYKKLKGNKKYPCVINFHGGGFVLGTAHDDARWSNIVVKEVGAVVVSVAYRLAPEYPFPTAVEDGADAILWLAQHAEELMLDPERFAVSGFSSGGNMSFTVPLCLQGELFDRTPSGARIIDGRAGSVPNAVIQPPPAANSTATPAGSSSRIPLMHQQSRLDRIAMLRQTGASSLSLVSSYKEGPAVSVMTQGNNSVVKIRGIVSFYPPTDYTVTRAQRRATCARADQNLPAVFTELFDDSYLQPPSLDLAHPWLSPGQAPTRMLEALPDDIVMFCCEWDMLLAEGERFRDKLQKDLGKRVHYHCVPGVPHGWDKAPNPLRESPGARQQYLVACKELRRMFDIDEDEEEHEHGDLPCRKYHKSVDMGKLQVPPR
ncbi:alpha/beta-hydrolase [Macroventuria anomochaeta]|uniref:Alpha/beta-hydrolase n=1 Tax=Macroventuria anomochaeta TaxID=301207 RepID=A0ACB6SHP6_9PLEO|nr:alpha/beta-hydrolase [Macroventuria anomochaeta]KAF2633825.1 alpha/beta-hydrolase [Macroventuria anomochaeta]